MEHRARKLSKKTVTSIAMTLALMASPFSHAKSDANWWADRYQHEIDHDVEIEKKRHHKLKDKSRKNTIKSNKAKQTKTHHRTHSPKHYHDRHNDHRTQSRKHYRNNDHRGYKNDFKKAGRWQTVTSFRGRSGRDAKRYLSVEDRVKAISIQGTKRSMYIRRAHALLGNGRWIRVEGLEGYVGRGDRIKHRLRRDRYVQQVVLEVEPGQYKRGYADLLVRPVRAY